MKSLIVGMGIGNLYLQVLTELGAEITTVDADPKKNADFTDIETAITQSSGIFDTVHICTPNFTHEPLARLLANHAKIVLVEKPGVINSASWKNLIKDFPNTRFYMVKNNQYREEINEFKNLYKKSKHTVVCWYRKNCVPNPGSWFTTKSKAFGGVSRDLIPHMLSYYTKLADIDEGDMYSAFSEQRHTLDSITDTEYGVIDPTGTYDVDDFCEIMIKNQNQYWLLVADWKTDLNDDSSITFDIDGQRIQFELGWCPEEAYKNMIIDITNNLNNDEFWINQNKQDIWIHEQIEKL